MGLPWNEVKRRTFVLFDLLWRAEDGEETEATTGELTEFIEKAKMGEITNQDIPKFAKMFKVCHRDHSRASDETAMDDQHL